MSLVSRSFTGAVLIVVTAWLRAALGQALPRRTFSALWWIAVLRLLVPWELPSRLSVYALPAWLHRTPAASAASAGEGAAVRILPGAGFPAAAAAGETAAQLSVSPWALVCAAGALLLAGWFAVSYLLCRRKFRMSLPAESGFVSRWRQTHPRISVRVSDRISAPLVYGFVRPVILLPRETDWSDETALAYILTHEEIHVRRLDGGTKLALAAALCVHWWNPAVWLMYALANRDLEISCDEAVVARLGGPADYARTLLRMEEVRAGCSPLCSHFSQSAVEERIVMMMKRKPRRYPALAAVCAVLLTAGVTAAFATSPRQIPGETGTEERCAGDLSGERQREILEAYGSFGVSAGEGGALFFEGEPVRCFWDGVELGQGRAVCCEYVNERGTVDIRTVRTAVENGDGSADPLGELIGVERYVEENFYALTHPAMEAAAVDSGGAGGQTFSDLFEKYAAFGVTCEAAEGSLVNVFYNGVPVRRFVDEKPDGGVFSYDSPGGGELVLRTVYDGGRLSGVDSAGQAASPVWPVGGTRVSAAFGRRTGPGGLDGCFHSGIDIAGGQAGEIAGSPVYAVLDGTVADAGYDTALGRYVRLDHGGGFQTVYAACAGVIVSEGDKVCRGDVIASVGSTGQSTGSHLHFEVWQDGEAQNPLEYFSQERGSAAVQPKN